MAPDDFNQQIAPLRRELHAHCYRMLGSVHDADDALQDALLGAWRGYAGFAGRSSLRSWLYTIATHACLAVIAKRPRRVRAQDHQPAAAPGDSATAPPTEAVPWLEPYPEDPQATYEQRERVELAFVAALQYLPGSQRAALLLCDVVGLSAAEAAEALDASVASITSALQRGRATVAARVPPASQQAELRALGEAGQHALVRAYMDAWSRSDVPAILALLRQDAQFTMPPIPTWFAGAEAIGRFMTERMFATPWQIVPAHASGQLAFVCYQGPQLHIGALNLLTIRDGQISEIVGFLDPRLHERFLLPAR